MSNAAEPRCEALSGVAKRRAAGSEGAQKIAQHGDVLVRVVQALRQGRELLRTELVLLVAEQGGDLADPALEAPALGLQLQGLRVAGGQSRVEAVQEWPRLGGGRRSEQLANVVDQHAVFCLSWGGAPQP